MSSSFIGIDFGSHTLKVVEISNKKKSLILEKAVTVPMTEGLITDGIVMDFGEVVSILNNAYTTNGFSNRTVNISIKGTNVLAKQIKVPLTTEEGLKTNFRFYADQYMFIEPEENAIDYRIIKADKMTSTARVIAGAAKKDFISDYLSVCESAKLKVQTIDIELFALVDLLNLVDIPNDGVTILIQLGLSSTCIIFVNEGNFSYSDLCEYGGVYCTELIQRLLPTSLEEAERYKSNPSTHSNSSSVTSIISESYTGDLLRGIEIAYSKYYNLGGGAPKRIVLSGAAAASFAIKDALADFTKLPVSILDPSPLLKIQDSTLERELKQSPTIYNVAIANAIKVRHQA